MNIVKISDVFFPRINGVSTSISIFRRELIARGHRVKLIAPTYPGADAAPDVTRVAARVVPFDPEDRLMKRRALLRACVEAASDPVDLVHVHTPFLAHRYGVRMARRLGVPVVETYHTFFEEYFHHYAKFLPPAVTRWLARGLSRSQCNAVDRLIVPSPPMKRVLDDYGVDTPAEILPTGLDLSELTNGDGERFRRKHGIHPSRVTMVHVGRLAFEKNIGFLLEVAARVRLDVPDLLLIIAGEGPAESSLRRRASQLGLDGHVLFTGYLARQNGLQDCYRAGDVFVFSSRTETQGLVLLEAMALGVPVVSTAVMGTRSIVEPERGALRADEDVGDFARKVTELLKNPGRRRRMAQDGREFVTKWSSEAMTDRLVNVYAKTMRSSDSGTAADT